MSYGEKNKSKDEVHETWNKARHILHRSSSKVSRQTVLSDVPTDLIININNTKYLLHKFPLILKCGLIQRICSDTDEESGQQIPIALHDIPGGEEAFELCAKFCYGITINLSAFNFVPAILAAKYLQMTESVTKNNFISKLELFFNSCILQGWKDAIVTLQSMWKISGWSDDPRIVQPCMDSIIEKILIHPSQVTWSYTYTRPGYDRKQRSIPKDWWTEDVSDLDLDLFRSIISTVRSTRKLPPALIGEVLHVYACKHLPNPKDMQYPAQSSSTRTDDTLIKHRRVLESIVSMIPKEPCSVSGGFLLRLLKIANYVGASSSTKAELIRRSSHQLDEVSSNDLLIPLASNPQHYDIGAVQALLESFLVQFRQTLPTEGAGRMIRTLINIGKTFDCYLKIIAQKADLPVSKFIDVAESLPEMAREEHDSLYQAIDTYLKEHPELSKGDRKRLCQMIDCRKLSSDARVNAIANDRLPLRTVVQLLFVEQERAGGAGGSHEGPYNQRSGHVSNARVTDNEQRKEARQQEVENQHRTEPGSGEKKENKRVARTISESKKTKEETQRTVRN